MPTVRYQGQTIEVEAGANLRTALRKAGLSPYNGGAAWVNCQGFGTCGTCAVRIAGDVSPPEAKGIEAARLGFKPHKRSSGLRLACQVKVEGDLEVEKLPGFWGQGDT